LDDTVTEPSQDFVPAPFEPADLQSDVLDLISENSALRAPLNGFGVRKVLIGLVGGLFVLGLVSLVSDLIAKSAPVETVAVQSFEELFAEGGGRRNHPRCRPRPPLDRPRRQFCRGMGRGEMAARAVG
jgi:hypothetical protein